MNGNKTVLLEPVLRGTRTIVQTAAILFTFTSTCYRLGIEPWAYLKDVLTRLPTTPKENLPDLLPDRWQAAQPQPPPAV